MKSVYNIDIYQIEFVRLSEAEQMPLLIDKRTGIPEYWTTLYVTTQIRDKGDAVGTIRQVLDILKLLMLSLSKSVGEINLEERLQDGLLLKQFELESLAADCRLKLEALKSDKSKAQAWQPNTSGSLEKLRLNTTTTPQATVGPGTTANRIRTIMDYLRWRVTVTQSRLQEYDPHVQSLEKAKTLLKETLKPLIPRDKNSSTILHRQGLSQEKQRRLFEIISRDSHINPWTERFTIVRNELMITLLHEYGFRIGEVLKVKLSDIDFRSNTITIRRRPHDKDETRIKSPEVKTLGRILNLTPLILDLLKNYILNHRAKISKARKHPYLLVSPQGAPFTLSAANKVFLKIKENFPDEFQNLSAHILRHTWNDNFTLQAKKNGLSDEESHNARVYAQGWTEKSKMPRRYTKGVTKELADKVIQKMSSDLHDELPW